MVGGFNGFIKRIENMVADTREKVTEMYETWTDNVRAAVDAGRRSQETFFKAFGDLWKTQPEMEGYFSRSERMAREFVPFLGKNVSTMSECMETTLRTGMDVLKAACDSASRQDDSDVYRRTRGVWDSTFGAARANFDAYTKASARMAENCSEFFRSACCTDAPKSTAKSGKMSA
jgi:hypothetical protein